MPSLLAPSPRTINHFIKDILGYQKSSLRDKSDTNQFHVRYTRSLNAPDNPQFDDLSGVSCVSSIVIDLYDGRVLDAYIKVNRGKAIRAFSDANFQNQHLNDILQYHFNLIGCAKEYFYGGWTLRERIQKELEDFKDRDSYLKKYECKGLLEKCKPWNREADKDAE